MKYINKDKSQKHNTEQKARCTRIHTTGFQFYKVQNQGNSSNVNFRDAKLL